ncbi:MAG: hypothetical protein QG609_493 [Patescibacteria group bacterium]|nr:hypothetical protein [Patescibacteria group bacterium]
MQKNLIIGLAVGLVLGGAGGFWFGVKNIKTNDLTSGMHEMSDGSMMTSEAEVMDMSDMMASMNKNLEGKIGDEFDMAFISEMILHHEGAVEMAELALTNAGHQEIKDLAQAVISAQNKEISDMKTWQMTWFNN